MQVVNVDDVHEMIRRRLRTDPRAAFLVRDRGEQDPALHFSVDYAADSASFSLDGEHWCWQSIAGASGEERAKLAADAMRCWRGSAALSRIALQKLELHLIDEELVATEAAGGDGSVASAVLNARREYLAREVEEADVFDVGCVEDRAENWLQAVDSDRPSDVYRETASDELAIEHAYAVACELLHRPLTVELAHETPRFWAAPSTVVARHVQIAMEEAMADCASRGGPSAVSQKLSISAFEAACQMVWTVAERGNGGSPEAALAEYSRTRLPGTFGTGLGMPVEARLQSRLRRWLVSGRDEDASTLAVLELEDQLWGNGPLSPAVWLRRAIERLVGEGQAAAA